MFTRVQRDFRLGVEQLERREMLSGGVLGILHPAAPHPASSVTDDYGNTFAQAALVSLSSAGSGSKSGQIGQAGDVDMFKFVAPVSGQMTIREVAAAGSRLDTNVYVYNANQQLVTWNDDYGGTLNSQVTMNVTAGTTYYVKAAAFSVSTGAYTLQFSTVATTADDYGNTFAAAKVISLSASGSGSQSGRIETSGDVDMFKFVAPVSGQMTIQQSAAAGSQLDSYVYVYNSSQQLLAQNDDFGGTRNSQVTISVTAGSTYYVKAGAYSTSTGAYTLAFSTVAGSTTTPSNPTQSGFQIDVSMSGFTTSEQQIVQQAVNRWEQIIVGDIPDVVYGGRVIDDLLINISAVTIDGVGGVLGQSAPTVVRSGSYLPCLGYIQLDTADVASMQSAGSLLGVLEHEIAHVLGFGVIWSNLGLLVGASTSNPGFIGAHAVAEYDALFHTSATAVPVEADGGSGTRLSHWDETVFGNELMTGWYNSGQTNPLSRITVASMADLGYQVNMAAADPYTPPASSLAVSVSASASSIYYDPFGLSHNSPSRSRSRDQVRAVDLIMLYDRIPRPVGSVPKADWCPILG